MPPEIVARGAALSWLGEASHGLTERLPLRGLISPAYVVAMPLRGVDARFFEYQFRIADYRQQINMASRGIVPDRNRLY